MKLHKKIQNGDLAGVDEQVLRGADLFQLDDRGISPLHLAVFLRHFDIVQKLCDVGAPVELGGPDGYTPLMLAAREGTPSMVDLLLSYGANPNSQTATEKKTPLMFGAGYNPHSEVVPALLKAGAFVNAQDSHGGTALLDAVWFGRAAAVRSLLAAGATASECNGRSLREIAISRGWCEVESILVQHQI